MIALLFDESIHNGIIRAIRLRNPEIDILRVQDTLLKGKSDEAVLEYALQTRRVLITHDLNSIPPLLTHMNSQGKEHHGVVFVPTSLPIGQVIDDLFLLPKQVKLRIGKTRRFTFLFDFKNLRQSYF